MGSWYMNLFDYMGGWFLWKFNSMGGGVKIKVPSSPSRYFFSGIALTQTLTVSNSISPSLKHWDMFILCDRHQYEP